MAQALKDVTTKIKDDKKSTSQKKSSKRRKPKKESSRRDDILSFLGRAASARLEESEAKKERGKGSQKARKPKQLDDYAEYLYGDNDEESYDDTDDGLLDLLDDETEEDEKASPLTEESQGKSGGKSYKKPKPEEPKEECADKEQLDRVQVKTEL